MKNWKDVFGWFSEAEVKKLQELAKDKICVEVGSYEGKSTCALGEVAKHVYAVDYFRSTPNGQTQDDKYTTLDTFKENTEGGPITICIGSSVSACRDFEKDSIDLLFVDALHTFEGVTCDVIAWFDRIKMGGIICFHDYRSFPAVKKAVDNMFKIDGVIGDFAWVTKRENILTVTV